jgi:LemA protein
MKALLVLVGLGVIVGIYGCTTYNGMVRADEHVRKEWADVESAYQRRADLVPNLVETVKGYMTHEKEVLENVAAARAKAGSVQLDASKLSDPAAVAQFQQAQAQLSGAFSRLLATSEHYPELKADRHFSELMSQIEGSENRINVERRKYNESVEDYNARIRAFPASAIAGLGHFQAKVPFQATTPGADKAPQVKF